MHEHCGCTGLSECPEAERLRLVWRLAYDGGQPMEVIERCGLDYQRHRLAAVGPLVAALKATRTTDLPIY